jgi:hypothetical protein
VATERPPRLDLSRPRAFGELLSASMQIFVQHADVLLTLAILLVTPATLLVDGVWGGALADGIDARPSLAVQAVSAALSVFVILPLVTAAGALIVQDLGRAEAPPDLGGLLRAAGHAFPRVVAAVIVYVALVLAGLVLFVVPGIWLAFRCYFAAQAAALEGLGPTAALRRSAEVVHGAWWRTLGYLLLIGLLLGATGSIAVSILASTGSGALYVAGRIVAESVAVAITAVFATLLFHDLRVRHERSADSPPETMAP